MGRELLRTWQTYDIEEVARHMLILGDVTGDCGACRELGIAYLEVRECPKCRTNFKYVTSRRLDAHPGERFQIVGRLRERRPELVFIDYEDYKRTLGRKKARDFFAK